MRGSGLGEVRRRQNNMKFTNDHNATGRYHQLNMVACSSTAGHTLVVNTEGSAPNSANTHTRETSCRELSTNNSTVTLCCDMLRSRRHIFSQNMSFKGRSQGSILCHCYHATAGWCIFSRKHSPRKSWFTGGKPSDSPIPAISPSLGGCSSLQPRINFIGHNYFYQIREETVTLLPSAFICRSTSVKLPS